MSDSKVDEKTLTSPASYSPTSASTFDSNFDLESGKKIRTPTWKTRIGLGEAPTVTLEQVRRQKSIAAESITETDTRRLESCPNGYPRLAGFLSSENNFSIYRGFSYLHSRVLLELQDEIASLERELDELDEVDNETVASQKRLKSRRFDSKRRRPEEDGFRPRQEILADIRTKLVEYDELLVKARDIQAFQRPSERDYKSVRTWFWNLKPLQDEKESAFIKKKEDVITLRSGREWSGFDNFVENTLRRVDCALVRKMFCTRELREKTNDKNVYYYSSSRVEAFVGLIITSIIFVLLVLPVVAMYKLTSLPNNSHGTFSAIGVLVVFTLLFSAAMSLLTKARRHELFAAAAAYCAVLVVFISNFSNNSVG